MNTKAVYRAAQAFLSLGLRTLRFNFRGVGCSTGTFDDGIGEEEDARAALDWLELGGVREVPIVLGGVSFGSMVSLAVGVQDPRVKVLVAMGTPIHVYDYSYLAGTDKPVLVIQGEHDEFGGAAEVQDVFRPLGNHITVKGIPGSGHLFEGFYSEMQAAIAEYFSKGEGQEVLAGSIAEASEVGP
jgi:hypothetical protein